jgi:hypothetical protein
MRSRPYHHQYSPRPTTAAPRKPKKRDQGKAARSCAMACRAEQAGKERRRLLLLV